MGLSQDSDPQLLCGPLLAALSISSGYEVGAPLLAAEYPSGEGSRDDMAAAWAQRQPAEPTALGGGA